MNVHVCPPNPAPLWNLGKVLNSRIKKISKACLKVLYGAMGRNWPCHPMFKAHVSGSTGLTYSSGWGC